MLVFHFGAELAAVTAPDFVTDYLVSRVGAAGVVTGEDFTFGKGRGGNVEVLKLLGQANRLSVDAVAPVDEDGEPVSSSRIREALQAGDCADRRPPAHPPVRDRGRGRAWRQEGPRARLSDRQYRRSAPICARASASMRCAGRLPDGRVLDGVANLGTRPMFDPPKELLEPYFFDFDGDLYGQTIEVALIAFLRDEAAFDGPRRAQGADRARLRPRPRGARRDDRDPDAPHQAPDPARAAAGATPSR